jgi:hypothetical protein
MSTIKYSEILTVTVAGYPIDCVMKPHGGYAIFVRQMKDNFGIEVSDSTGKKYLKPLVDKDLNRLSSMKVRTQDGAVRTVKAYDIELFMEAVAVYAGLGNDRCLALLIALATETLERRLDAAFGVKVSEQDRERKAATRAQSIVTRRTLTDRLKDLGFTEGVDYAKLTLQIYDAAGVRNLYQEWKDSGSKIPFRDTLEWIQLYTIEKKEDQLIDLLAHKLMVHEAVKLLGR